MLRLLALLLFLLPATALAADLSSSSDAELTVLAADPDWTVRLDAQLEQALRDDADLLARRLAIAPRATRAGFLRFPTEIMNVPDAAPVLLHRLRTESDPAVRGALADSFARQSGDWGDALLELFDGEPSADVRAIHAHALRFIPPPQARALLEAGLADSSALVRSELVSLVARRADGVELAPMLVAGLADAEPTVRVAAAHSIGALKIDASESLLPLLADEDAQVRLEALRALDRIGTMELRSVEQVRVLSQDVDSRVARKAAKILAN